MTKYDGTVDQKYHMNIVGAVLMREYDRIVALEQNWYRMRKSKFENGQRKDKIGQRERRRGREIGGEVRAEKDGRNN